MAEQTSTTKRRSRVRITFTADPRALRPRDEQDPVVDEINRSPGWILEVTESAGDSLGTWEVWHPGDIESEDTARFLSVERALRALDQDVAAPVNEEYVQLAREKAQLVAPYVTAEVFTRLTHRHMIAIGNKAWERPGETAREKAERKADTQNPPDGERASDSLSRSPHGSLVGVTPS